MRMAVGFVASQCLLFGMAGSAHADAREDQAKEVRDEIALRKIECHSVYFGANTCGKGNVCEETLEAIRDYQVDLNEPDRQKSAVQKWWRFVSGEQVNASCMRVLLSTDTYCKAVNLVKAFDPHTNCPASGGTTGTCWINQDVSEWRSDRDDRDWIQGCQFAE